MHKLDTKTNLLDHSEAKVKLLGEYIKRYLNIISNDGYTETIHIHDLFCGQGLYKNGRYGSPLVTLMHVKQTYFSKIAKSPQKLPKINCYFNDIDKTKIDILGKSIEESSLYYPSFGKLNLSNNDYKKEVTNLKSKFKIFRNDKAFVFIDPYGYKEILANDIRELLGENKKSEILLWLPIQFMYRFAGEGTPPVLKNFMAELNVQEKVKNAQNVWEFISILKKGFQNYLGDVFFVDNFSLQKEENTIFCLFFFTSHIKGFEKMLEAKWEIDTEEGRGWKYTGNTPNLFSDQKTHFFESLLKVYLKSDRKYNCDLFQFTLRNSFLPKHATQILSNLQKNGELEVFLENGQKARKGSFYIKYFKHTDVKSNKKVYFVLK